MEEQNKRVYIRILELMALGTEDWGKVVENSNNFLQKGWNRKDAEQALVELQKITSPLHELEALLVIEIQKMMQGENKK